MPHFSATCARLRSAHVGNHADQRGPGGRRGAGAGKAGLSGLGRAFPLVRGEVAAVGLVVRLTCVDWTIDARNLGARPRVKDSACRPAMSMHDGKSDKSTP